MNDQNSQSRVVIVGGGFAGLFAARMLARAPVQVTLLDRAEHHLFQPMLYQCATGILSEGKIAAPLRELLKKHANVEFVIAEATGIDPDRRPLGKPIEFDYDYLIVAAGVRQSYFGHDEYAPIAPGMKTIEDAMKIRRRVYGAFELAESEDDPAERARYLTFALVGAGPTGVELAGQIREVATKTLRREYRRIKPEDARVLLFDGGSAPLAAFGSKLSALAARDLQKLGVELHMGSVVTAVDSRGLQVKNHDDSVSRHEAGTVLWTAGVEAPPLAEAVATATGAERDRAGRIKVGDNLTIPGHPEVFVLGDLMSAHGLPGMAEVAMQSGLYAARQIRRQVEGRERPAGDPEADGGNAARPFRYRDLGSAAYISRGRAAVAAGRLHFSGFPGWLAWLFIHIAFLTGYRNRAGAILSWWVAFTRDIRRERAYTTQEVGHVQDIYNPTGAIGDLAAPRPPAPRPAPPGQKARRAGT